MAVEQPAEHAQYKMLDLLKEESEIPNVKLHLILSSKILEIVEKPNKYALCFFKNYALRQRGLRRVVFLVFLFVSLVIGPN